MSNNMKNSTGRPSIGRDHSSLDIGQPTNQFVHADLFLLGCYPFVGRYTVIRQWQKISKLQTELYKSIFIVHELISQSIPLSYG